MPPCLQVEHHMILMVYRSGFHKPLLYFLLLFQVKWEKSTKSRVSKGSYFLLLRGDSELIHWNVIDSGVFLVLIDPLTFFIDIFFSYSSQEPDILSPLNIFYKIKINETLVMMQESIKSPPDSITFCHSVSGLRPTSGQKRVPLKQHSSEEWIEEFWAAKCWQN